MKLAGQIKRLLNEAVDPLQVQKNKSQKMADALRKELKRLGTSEEIDIVQKRGHWNTAFNKFAGSLDFLEITDKQNDESFIVIIHGGNMNKTDKVFSNLLKELKKMKPDEADYDDVLGSISQAANKSGITQPK